MNFYYTLHAWNWKSDAQPNVYFFWADFPYSMNPTLYIYDFENFKLYLVDISLGYYSDNVSETDFCGNYRRATNIDNH